MKTFRLITLLFSILTITSCSDNDDPVVELPKGEFENGYFISNEGPFQNGNGTLTFIDQDGSIQQNVYKTVNNEDLGNIVNSITLSGDYAYIIVNNSNRIIVANRYTMEKISVLDGENVNNPRYMVSNGITGYISNWGDPLNAEDDFITVIDLQTNIITNTISVGEGPENMYLFEDILFVNLKGGWSQNNKVEIISTISNTISKSIEVGVSPNSIVGDDVGNIWVLCGGMPSWAGDETPGSLYKIRASNLEFANFDFNPTDHPEQLTGDEGILYYNLNGKVYGMDSKTTDLPIESIDGLDGFYYNLIAYHGDLYALDAKDYSSEGALKVFNPISGVLVNTYKTGIIPGDIAFQ